MITRRSLLSRAALAGAAASTTAASSPVARARRRVPTPPPTSPVDPAADKDFWAGIHAAFDLDHTMINLNNGGCSPSPRVVHEAYQRQLDHSNLAPSYTMWRQLEPGKETVRTLLAEEAGCDREELAITRNASEALQIAQLGLDLQPGDEVLMTDQDYPRMRNTWRQRERRDGIVLTEVSFPVPLTETAPLIEAFEAARTERTKVVHLSHVVFMTGQILPVKEVCAWAREHGLVTIVDGAHAFAQVPTNLHDMGCDYYGTSLHKWLMAPIGTGFLYVRRERIAAHWALQPAPEAKDDDIRKFEAIGTHPAAGHNAVAEAVAFHRAMGLPRKRARLAALRHRWSVPLAELDNVTVHSPHSPEWTGAKGLVELQGIKPGPVVSEIWRRGRIVVTPIVHDQFRGIRVSPNVYTRMEDVDRFVEIFSEIAADPESLSSPT